MMIGYGFPFKTFDVYKATGIIIVSIALAAHTTRAMLVQGIKIMIYIFFVQIVAGPAALKRTLHTLP